MGKVETEEEKITREMEKIFDDNFKGQQELIKNKYGKQVNNEEKSPQNIKKLNNKKSKKNRNNNVNVIQKVKNILCKIPSVFFNTRLFTIFVAGILLLKTMLLYKFAIFPNETIKPEYVYMPIPFIAIFILIPMLLKSRARFWVTLIIDLIISILLCINEVYYSYSTNLVSVSQISNLQYGREISVALPNIVSIRQILYFIDIIIILILVIAKKIKLQKKAKYRLWIGIIYLAGIITIASNKIPDWLEEAQKHQYNKILQIESSSIYGYHYLDIKNNLDMKKNVKYKTKTSVLNAYNELKDEYNSKYTLQYDFSNIAKDKNVIIVQLESVQNFVVNRSINGYEITPNLNKFFNENIEFTNMQNQSYSTTADAEYGVMNSLYPLENGMSFAQYPSNDYNDIYQNFKKNDYITTYIHGNESSFWNRYAVYSRLKIDNLLFDDIFDENTERINKYISDEQVYRRIVEELKSYDDKFFVNIIAASSHMAFDLPGIEDKESKVNIDVGDEYRDMFFGNYLEAVNYADYAFGIFIDELKQAGLYDDTVIFVYGDHAGMQMYNWEMQDFIKEARPLNDIQTQINYSNVLCGMKIPEVCSMKIDKPVSKLDIKPTLMQLCGIEDEFSLGMSLFSNKDFVCINNGRIITDKYFYDGDWYSIQTGEQLDLSSMPNAEVAQLDYYCDCLQKELDISLSINVLNLLKK